MQANIEITTLPSGLTVITDAVPTVATATLGFWLGVGARNEPSDASGVAHLVEHMLFKGTPTRDVYKIATELEDVGAILNAHTGKEETAYYCKLLSEDAERGIDIYSDMLLNASLPEEDFKRERNVIVQEINQIYDEPEQFLYDEFQKHLYAGQLYGRPIIGSAEEIAVMDKNKLARYIDTHYHADNTIFVAAGNVNHKRVCEWVDKHTHSMKRGAKTTFEAPTFVPAHIALQRDVEQVHMMLAMPCATYGEPDYYAVNVFAQIMGGGMSSRLFTEVREKRGLVYQVSTYTVQYNDTGTFYVYACATPDKAGEVWRVVADEMARFASTITDAELNRAKMQLKAQLLMSLESTGRRADNIGGQWHTYGRIIPLAETLEKLNAVTKADVAKVGEKLRKGSHATGMCGPVADVKDMPDVGARLAA